MCTVAVIDTDVLWKVAPAPNKSGDSDLCAWIDLRHGILAYSNSGQYFDELFHSRRVWRVFEEYRRGQQATLVSASQLADAEKRLRNSTIRSNDKHILVLALASDALVLCSNDNRLKNDFTRAGVLPKVGHRSHALYPVDAPRKDRRAFLKAHECPTRTMT